MIGRTARRALTLILACALLVGVATMAGQRIVGLGFGQAPPPDPTYRGMLTVQGRQIPLPPGDWRIVGQAEWPAGAARAPAVSVALLRVTGRSADAAVLIQVNRLGATQSWGRPTGCGRADFPFARVRYASDHDLSCAYVAFVGPVRETEGVDPAWTQALRHAVDRGWSMPAKWLMAAYRIADPRDAQHVRYLYAPSGDAADERFLAWTEATWTVVGSGFRNRLIAAEATIPTDWRDASASGGARSSVGSLGEDRSTSAARLATKAITYRALASATDFAVAYAWLGSVAAAGGLSLVGSGASSVLYVLHEGVWAYADSSPPAIGDLPGAGPESPN